MGQIRYVVADIRGRAGDETAIGSGPLQLAAQNCGIPTSEVRYPAYQTWGRWRGVDIAVDKGPQDPLLQVFIVRPSSKIVTGPDQQLKAPVKVGNRVHAHIMRHLAAGSRSSVSSAARTTPKRKLSPIDCSERCVAHIVRLVRTVNQGPHEGAARRQEALR
jgi:hypothetical protein